MGEAGGGRAESSPCALHARWEQIAAASARHEAICCGISPAALAAPRALAFPPSPPQPQHCVFGATSTSPAPTCLHQTCTCTHRGVLQQEWQPQAGSRDPQPPAPVPRGCPGASSALSSSPELAMLQGSKEQLLESQHPDSVQAPPCSTGTCSGSSRSSLPTPRSPATRRGQAQLCRVSASREPAGSWPG